MRTIKEKLHGFLFPSFVREKQSLIRDIHLYQDNVKTLENARNSYRMTVTERDKELNKLLLDVSSLKGADKVHQKKIQELTAENKRLSLVDREATLADLMRKNLALITIDFASAGQDGMPEHYMPMTMPDSEVEVYIAKLNEVYNNDVFQKACKYLIDCQGNYTVRQGLTFEQDLAGRFTINGIQLVLTELIRAHVRYEEAARPPDSFDEHEVL